MLALLKRNKIPVAVGVTLLLLELYQAFAARPGSNDTFVVTVVGIFALILYLIYLGVFFLLNWIIVSNKWHKAFVYFAHLVAFVLAFFLATALFFQIGQIGIPMF